MVSDNYTVDRSLSDARLHLQCELRSSHEPTRLFGFDGTRLEAQSKAQMKPTDFGEQNGILRVCS